MQLPRDKILRVNTTKILLIWKLAGKQVEQQFTISDVKIIVRLAQGRVPNHVLIIRFHFHNTFS